MLMAQLPVTERWHFIKKEDTALMLYSPLPFFIQTAGQKRNPASGTGCRHATRGIRMQHGDAVCYLTYQHLTYQHHVIYLSSPTTHIPEVIAVNVINTLSLLSWEIPLPFFNFIEKFLSSAHASYNLSTWSFLGQEIRLFIINSFIM